MAVRVLAGIIRRLGKRDDFLESVGLGIELGKPALVDFERLADLGVEREHSLAARCIREHGEAGKPRWAFAGHHRSRAGESLVVDEVCQIDANLWLEATMAGQRRRGARDVEITQ